MESQLKHLLAEAVQYVDAAIASLSSAANVVREHNQDMKRAVDVSINLIKYLLKCLCCQYLQNSLDLEPCLACSAMACLIDLLKFFSQPA